MNTPDTISMILNKLCTQAFKSKAPVYFVIDRMGRIHQWGGDLSAHNITEPEEESTISKTLPFMEGILPLKGQSMEFSDIKMPGNPDVSDAEPSKSPPVQSFANAHLFKTDDGYGLLIWKTHENNYSIKDDIFLTTLFKSLNFAVMEMDHQGHFVLIGTPPTWVEQLPQSSRKLKGKKDKEDVFSFLNSFIQEVKSKWESNELESLRTGIWTVNDDSDQELFFEATAVNIQGRKLLIISHDVSHPDTEKPFS